MYNPYNLIDNPNKSNRGSACGPPRQDHCSAMTRGFLELIKTHNPINPYTPLFS